jgi:hypothetical protein
MIVPVSGLPLDCVSPWSCLGKKAIIVRRQDLLDLSGCLGRQEDLRNLTREGMAYETDMGKKTFSRRVLCTHILHRIQPKEGEDVVPRIPYP